MSTAPPTGDCSAPCSPTLPDSWKAPSHRSASPRHPVLMLRFALRGLRSAVGLAKGFRGVRARALLAGCAAHAILPLDRAVTAAVALMFLVCGHEQEWPVAEGGSQAIARALTGLLRSLGGRVETGVRVSSLAELPAARLYLFDTSPAQLATIAAPVLPRRYVRRLERFRYGPGIFKLDWALGGSIPWKDSRCLGASTVHLGGDVRGNSGRGGRRLARRTPRTPVRSPVSAERD
jgi:phytoene dehydrogenase-like protein